MKGISVIAVAGAGAGALVIWSGLKGASVTGSLRSLISGKHPSGKNVYPVGSGTLSGASGGIPGTTDSQIANDALRYQGAGYVWGGSPASGAGNWDCSSFGNWVIGRDLSLSIPGYPHGSYTGRSHGPVTMQWALWRGAVTIPRFAVRAGDLCIWPAFHMGIAISNSQMISALNPSLGTKVTGIDGTAGGPLVCRRLR